jgi:hypothetical protein
MSVPPFSIVQVHKGYGHKPARVREKSAQSPGKIKDHLQVSKGIQVHQPLLQILADLQKLLIKGVHLELSIPYLFNL